MAKPRPKKKDESPQPPTRRVLPMKLQVDDRIMDETGEWEVTGRPFTTAAGKNAHARVADVGRARRSGHAGWRLEEERRARHRRAPLAPLAPHQPRPARDAAYALERGSRATRSGSALSSAGDPTR
jgi:hypothetical protein